jgi:FtsH-binding integral membrane protein
MSYQDEATWIPGNVAQASLDERQIFIRKTYGHLLGAVAAFVALSYFFYQAGIGRRILEMLGDSQYGWLLILGGFMVVGWMASAMAAQHATGLAYAGLFIYVIAEALIFSPVLFIAHDFYPGVLPQATILTALVFAGLTFYVFTTKKDFSFLGPALLVVGIAALGAIVLGAVFGWNLGAWFSVLMILFACAAILYTTSKVLHKYTPSQYVAASLEIFASVALLFWYILRLLMDRR